MKLSELKQNLGTKLQKINTNNTCDQVKIIGVTGSKGKSTVCYILQEYLKLKGKKTTLYSSIKIDAENSLYSKDEALNRALENEVGLYKMINNLTSDQEYLILEVNEKAIEEGLTKDLPFKVRCLTNLNPRHNLEQYSEEEYVNLKKSFFKDFSEECTCVYGLVDYDKPLFQELLEINDMPKITFSSNYISQVKNVDKDSITCLLTNIEEKENGYAFTIKLRDQEFVINTATSFKYNILNYLCVISILDALNEFDVELFNRCINSIKIPGRVETIKVKGRTIIVDLYLASTIQELSKLKETGKIKNIKVVLGSVGHGFINWDDTFNKGRHFQKRHETRSYVAKLLKDYADYVYLTENDQGVESVQEIGEEIKIALGTVKSEIIPNREEAIKKAIENSKVGDVIFISGRGNRKILCTGEKAIKFVSDIEIVNETIKKLGW